jgi:signal transduction histidine kinase
MKKKSRKEDAISERRWRSASVRLIALSTVFVLAAIGVLLGFIAVSVSSAMMRQIDSLLTWQLIYFDSIPTAELPQAIQERLKFERVRVNFYGLFDPDGRHLAGDVLALPTTLRPIREGVTFDGSLRVEGLVHAPVVRVMAEKRENGETLLIVRDISSVLEMRSEIFHALFAGGALILVIGLVSGLLLTLRQARRLKEIRLATHRIAQGELGQRLPMTGRDEIEMLAHLVNHMLDEVERLMHEVKGACDGIAHDLRTPLSHVRTLLTQIDARSSLGNDATMDALVTRARGEVDFLLERFRALLRISEISTLKRHSGFDHVSLNDLIVELKDLFEPLAESRNIQLTLGETVATTVRGDRALLFEALSNLLDNALKFTPEGGEVTLSLTILPDGPMVQVTDNGPGIKPEERDAVLQRFYRTEGASHIAGSGLGLSIVSAIVQLHDFKLKITDAKTVRRSADGPGACITIECWPQSLT